MTDSSREGAEEMTKLYEGRRRLWLPISVAAALTIAMLVAVGSSAATKTSLKGTLTTQPVTGPACASPVGVCFTGMIDGKLKGTLTGTGTTLTPTVDTPTTSVIVLTGDVVVQTTNGTLMLKDATLLSTSGGEFSAIWTVIGGTGVYEQATGTIQVTGSFVPGGGPGTGTYVGQLTIS